MMLFAILRNPMRAAFLLLAPLFALLLPGIGSRSMAVARAQRPTIWVSRTSGTR